MQLSYMNIIGLPKSINESNSTKDLLTVFHFPSLLDNACIFFFFKSHFLCRDKFNLKKRKKKKLKTK